MPQVTVGVPVYNAESLLERGLENIRAQTYRDIKVIILDNASTDQTADIAQRFVQNDPRFAYHQQPFNKGARTNFSDVLALAESPYFMWRAYDDLSDDTFIEALVDLLEKNVDADLAVTRVISKKPRGDRVSFYPRQMRFEPSALYRIRLLFESHSSWTYAMFRTDALKRSFADVQARFPHLIAADHLTIFPFLATGRVVGTNEIAFVQGFNMRGKPNRHPLRDPREMRAVRLDFLRYCTDSLPILIKDPIERTVLRPVLCFYAGRSYRFHKILGAYVRTWLGEKPALSASGVGYGDGPAEPSE